jgi:hypothetical protein
VSSLGYTAAAETLLSLRGNCGMAQCMEALKGDWPRGTRAPRRV